MKLHLSMPNDGQSNIYLYNGLRKFAKNHAFNLHLSFTDHRNDSLERVVEYTNAAKPDVCLFLYLNNIGEFIDYIDCPIKCGWTFDVTFGGKYFHESVLVDTIRKLDYFFSVSPEQAKVLGGYWAPEGFDPCSHYPIFTNKDYDITFVGQIVENSDYYREHGFVHLDREPWLVEIAKKYSKQLELFGPVYGDVLVSGLHTRKILKTAVENNIVSTNSKINLGHSGHPHIKYAWSARDLRIMASQGFLITNKVVGHEDFFLDGENIVWYESTEECVDKIGFYLDKPEVRARIARNGRLRTESIFTFAHSFEKIFTHMGLL